MKIDLTQQEAQVLVNLLDVAVKAAGLPAAEAALLLAKRVQEAQQKPAEDSNGDV